MVKKIPISNKICPISQYALKRVNQNQNLLLMISGATGSGKSYVGLTIAAEIDPDFNEHQIVFNVEEFIKLLNEKKQIGWTTTINEEGAEVITPEFLKIKRGMVILFEEVGVSIDNRSFYTNTNKAVNYIMQTFRDMGLVIIFTVPVSKFVDIKTRNLIHASIETRKIYRRERLCKIKFYLHFHFNNRRGESQLGRKRITIKTSDGRYAKVNSFLIKKPEAIIVHKYEKARLSFREKLTKDTLSIMPKLNTEPVQHLKGTRGILTPRQQSIYELYMKGYTYQAIAKKFNIHASSISGTKRFIEAKGYAMPKRPRALKLDNGTSTT